MSFINAKKLGHKFDIRDKDGNVTGEKWALKSVDIKAEKGQMIAVLGKNGSGKSTFAKHLNGLLLPDEGAVIIGANGAFLETSNKDHIFEIRQSLGMVFQNPDNQVVGNTVEEDVGFGLQNLQVEREMIWEKIHNVLELVDMNGLSKRSVSALSGGQKQRLAIASVMAMEPSCIILDEATSMLDPEGAARVLNIVAKLREEQGITVIMITHRIEETMGCDYIYVLDEGALALEGPPADVFPQVDALESHGLEAPLQYRLLKDLDQEITSTDVVTIPHCAEIIKGKQKEETARKLLSANKENITVKSAQEPLIVAENLAYTYTQGGTSIPAVNDISFTINKGEFVAVAGHTGSGKSTLLYMINGINRPQSGALHVAGFDVENVKNLKDLRKQVGFVFQYPEHQLFEETVLADVMYGPKNFGMSKKDAKEAAKKALALVGIGEEFYDYSPFDLSGGQRKRVALAGILAYEPKLLILDEPVAGLDPQGKKGLFTLLKKLNKELETTIIFVSHDMEDVYDVAERILVMKSGKLAYDGAVAPLLESEDEATSLGLQVPAKAMLKNLLEN